MSKILFLPWLFLLYTDSKATEFKMEIISKYLMKTLIISALLIFITCSFSDTEVAMADGEIEKQAIESSLAWLDLIDKEQYAESWETAAEYFKNIVSMEEWMNSLTGVRKPLGKVITRTLKTKEYTKILPGAPDGEYVVIQYEASFENKNSAIETVTSMLDKDGKWRLSGYYIK